MDVARRAVLGLVTGSSVMLSGCATVSGKSTQTLRLEVLDARDRPVADMSCKLTHAPSAEAPAPVRAFELVVTTPATSVDVRRSAMPLSVECRKGKDVALATVHPRRDGLEQALVPFGSVAVFIDHVTGSLYAYPSELRLRLGQHVKLEHGEQSRVVSTEAIAGASTVIASEPLALVAPAAPAATPRPAEPQAATPAKPPARAPITRSAAAAPATRAPAVAARSAPLTW